MKNTREFFDCDLSIIKKAFTEVNIFFVKYNSKEKIFAYLIKNHNLFFKNSITSISINLVELCDNVFLGKQIEDKYLNISKILKEYIIHDKKYKVIYIDNTKTNIDLITKEEKINNWINIHYLKLLKHDFDKQIMEINNSEIIQMSNYNIVNKINCCLWLEELIGFSRFEIDKIKCDDIEGVKKILIKNTEKLYPIYKNNNCINKIIKSIKHKINSIITPFSLKFGTIRQMKLM